VEVNVVVLCYNHYAAILVYIIRQLD